MRLKLYLSGPMSGRPGHNFAVFNKTARNLRERGYTVINPAENYGGRTDLPRHDYLRADITSLLDVNAIAMLPGWWESKGASLEYTISAELGQPAFCASCLASGETLEHAARCYIVAAYQPLPLAETIAEDTVAARIERMLSTAVSEVYTPQENDTFVKEAEDRSTCTVVGFEAIGEEDDDTVYVLTDKGRALLDEINKRNQISGGDCLTAVNSPNLSVRGERFATGSQRDSRRGKGRYDLLPWVAIDEVAKVCEEGAEKYGARNIERGQPISRLLDSGVRHISEYMRGIHVEPRVLGRAAWNILWAIQFDLTRPDLVDVPAEMEYRRSEGVEPFQARNYPEAAA